MLVVVAIIGILFSIAIPAYETYQDKRHFLQARQDLLAIQKSIDLYYVQNNEFPESLNDVGLQDARDPWGESYYYVNMARYNKKTSPYKVRRDKKLKPVNSDYDLYSAGKDGETSPPFSAKSSRDDIVRCNNGRYLGYAKDY
jgi:general secretion pathway protein G